jgi:hypothetical protein
MVTQLSFPHFVLNRVLTHDFKESMTKDIVDSMQIPIIVNVSFLKGK